MRKGNTHPDQLDLFENFGQVIDARKQFQKRTNDFIRLLICGYRPPTSGGPAPVDFAAYRSNGSTRRTAATDARRSA